MKDSMDYMCQQDWFTTFYALYDFQIVCTWQVIALIPQIINVRNCGQKGYSSDPFWQIWTFVPINCPANLDPVSFMITTFIHTTRCDHSIMCRIMQSSSDFEFCTWIEKTVYCQSIAHFSNTWSNHTTALYNGGYPGHRNIQNRRAFRLFNIPSDVQMHALKISKGKNPRKPCREVKKSHTFDQDFLHYW